MSNPDREAFLNWTGTLKDETVKLVKAGVFDGVVFQPEIIDFVFHPDVEAAINERRLAQLYK